MFKKSGPGPKNGEQYGAPFKEEDWADDECADVNDLVTLGKPVRQHNDVTSADNVPVLGELEPPLNDFEIIKQTADESALDQPKNSDYTHVLPQVGFMLSFFINFFIFSTHLKHILQQVHTIVCV